MESLSGKQSLLCTKEYLGSDQKRFDIVMFVITKIHSNHLGVVCAPLLLLVKWSCMDYKNKFKLLFQIRL